MTVKTYTDLINVPIYGPKLEEWVQEHVKFAKKKQEFIDGEGRLDPFIYDEAGNLVEMLAKSKTVKDYKNPGQEITLAPTYFLKTQRLDKDQTPILQVIEQKPMKIIDEQEFLRDGKTNPNFGEIVEAECISHVLTAVRKHGAKSGKLFGLPIAFRFLDQVKDDDGAFHYRQAGVKTVDSKGEIKFLANTVHKKDWYGVLVNGWQCLGHGTTSSYVTAEGEEIIGLKNVLFNQDPDICPLRVKGRTAFEGITNQDLEAAFDIA